MFDKEISKYTDNEDNNLNHINNQFDLDYDRHKELKNALFEKNNTQNNILAYEEIFMKKQKAKENSTFIEKLLSKLYEQLKEISNKIKMLSFKGSGLYDDDYNDNKYSYTDKNINLINTHTNDKDLFNSSGTSHNRLSTPYSPSKSKYNNNGSRIQSAMKNNSTNNSIRTESIPKMRILYYFYF